MNDPQKILDFRIYAKLTILKNLFLGAQKKSIIRLSDANYRQLFPLNAESPEPSCRV